MSGSIYERELKEILNGNDKIIERISKNLNEDEKTGYQSMLKHPFLVLRAAGSLGVDLVAIRDDFSFPIEVKSSKFEIIRFAEASSRAQNQALHLIQETERAHVFPVYAYRLKRAEGDPWRIFALNVEKLDGNLKLLHRLLPGVPMTSKGNYILKWNEGFPLNKLLSYMNFKKLKSIE